MKLCCTYGRNSSFEDEGCSRRKSTFRAISSINRSAIRAAILRSLVKGLINQHTIQPDIDSKRTPCSYVHPRCLLPLATCSRSSLPKGASSVLFEVAELIQTKEPHGRPIVANPSGFNFSVLRTADINPTLGPAIATSCSHIRVQGLLGLHSSVRERAAEIILRPMTHIHVVTWWEQADFSIEVIYNHSSL